VGRLRRSKLGRTTGNFEELSGSQIQPVSKVCFERQAGAAGCLRSSGRACSQSGARSRMQSQHNTQSGQSWSKAILGNQIPRRGVLGNLSDVPRVILQG
jgi:hypothetical protein